MKRHVIRSSFHALFFATSTLLVSASLAQADEDSPRRFVVTLDEVAGAKLSAAQAAATASEAADSPEHRFGVALKEVFRASGEWYEVLEADSEQLLTDYLAALEVAPIGMIESEFINSPVVGGGPKAGDVPRDGHRIYVIERAVPGISELPMEEQVKISQGSQSVVAQFGDSLEWDRSFLNDEGTFCVYRTDDENKIREHADIAGFPADKVSRVEHIVRDYVFR